MADGDVGSSCSSSPACRVKGVKDVLFPSEFRSVSGVSGSYTKYL